VTVSRSTKEGFGPKECDPKYTIYDWKEKSKTYINYFKYENYETL